MTPIWTKLSNSIEVHSNTNLAKIRNRISNRCIVSAKSADAKRKLVQAVECITIENTKRQLSNNSSKEQEISVPKLSWIEMLKGMF